MVRSKKSSHSTFNFYFSYYEYIFTYFIELRAVFLFFASPFFYHIIEHFLLSLLLLTQLLTPCLLSSLCSKKNFLLFYFFYAWIHIFTYYALFFIENLFLLSSLVLLQRIVNGIVKYWQSGYAVIHKHKICEHLTYKM